jgi:nicotinamidase/pyrazinamidase
MNETGPGAALIVVDVQRDFLPGGALAVPEGDRAIPMINRMAPKFDNIIMTQDWHPKGHASFASSHPGKKPYDTVDMPYGRQVLWPDHCLRGTDGAAFGDGLELPACQLIIRKGYHTGIDSYSAFMENDHKTPTGLAGYLRERGVARIYLAGLAADFCVLYTALDGRAAGFEVFVALDACRGLDIAGSMDKAMGEMARAGAVLIRERDL